MRFGSRARAHESCHCPGIETGHLVFRTLRVCEMSDIAHMGLQKLYQTGAVTEHAAWLDTLLLLPGIGERVPDLLNGICGADKSNFEISPSTAHAPHSHTTSRS